MSVIASASVAADALLELLPGSVVFLDTDFRVVACNAAWAREAGVTAADAIGLDYFDLMPGIRQWKGACERSMGGEPIRVENFKIIGPDGAPVWVDVAMAPWGDGTGPLKGIWISLSRLDKGGDDHLYMQRLEDAVALAGIYVWEINYETKQTWGAGAAETTFQGGNTYRQAVADPMFGIHPDHRERVAAVWAAQRARGEDCRAEYRANREDKEVWGLGSRRITYGADGQPRRMLGVSQDITDRKRAELAAREASEAKSAFLATMSHEIRTPLNGVLGMAQAMAADELSPEQRQRLQVVRDSGEALLTILNDILDLSKIEADKLELETIEFDFEAVASSAHAPFTAAAEAKGVTLDLDVAAASGVYRGDPTRLRQILYNLTSNALKFTSQGEVSMTAGLQDGALVIGVRDSGIGIPEDRLAGLFDRFTQVDTSTTRKYGGTGLGLSICRRLAQLMGGTIEVESRLGEGSTFRLTLPLERVRDANAQADETADDGAATDLGRLRVLAAEDNAVNRLVLQTLLGGLGAETVLVEDGLQAVEAWREGRWDIILMDVQMPEMDGLTATRAIRAEEAQRNLARTPIIALSADAMAHHIAECHAAGMDGHVGKPFELAHLVAVIASHCADAKDEGLRAEAASA